ncbi:MAG: DUF2723 domain-containing protein [Bacteroidia bacterium]|nr:DUF2723 domain-containing protein [Bacteroidia bacterium]
MSYSRINTLLGWIVFAIATAVYGLTVEPSVSFWDCGEFIASSYKLQVGHPPGAPLFMMIGRVFSLFASGPDKVALWINFCSALCSSFTILFLFWTITAFAKKIAQREMEDGQEFSLAQKVAIFGSGLVGSLAYTFSDSFWFSAVEGEVYAMSSFFTAVVFWAIMKWESVADEPHSNRWLILIAYLMGLSVGVHLLNLLCIPAITFVFYYKKFQPTRTGFIYATLAALGLLVFIQYGVIPGTVVLASKFELFFANTLGMGFNSGLWAFILVVIASLSYGLYYTQTKELQLANTAILCLTVILIGYSSYALIVVRSNANPPMNENAPNNAFALLSYLNREQYGDRPLLYGQYYNTPLDIDYEAQEYRYEDGTPTYVQVVENGKEKYVIGDDRKGTIPVYDPKYCTFFPRMYSNQKSHISAYKSYGHIKGRKVFTNRPDVEDPLVLPTFGENLTFFFSYQITHMYLRYFMWNFAGRQNDIQGNGSILEGGWISGIDFIDNISAGPQNNLSPNLKNSRARNTLFMLPLIIGLLGLYFQFTKDARDGWVVLLLFLFTGLAIVVYLNQYPYQPRERDYAYAASFYAFCIWVGLGMYALYEMLGSTISKNTAALAAFAITFLGGPVLMAKEEWNDHDRSGKYTARDFAANYLNSCAPNSILFTNGDNDTFPLWYAQEVEGVRTDIRVVNLSLLGTEWYIDQMKRKVYESEPLPLTMKEEDYHNGNRDFVQINPQDSSWYKITDVMEFILSNAPESKVTMGKKQLPYCPTRYISVPVDTALVRKNGTITELNGDSLVTELKWVLKGNYLLKNDLAVMDIIAHNNWKRPIYFAITVGGDGFMNLEDYFQLEGLAYRLVPAVAKRKDGMPGRVAASIMYENVMNKFKWGDMKNPNLNIDPETMRMTTGLRLNLNRLAEQLMAIGEKDKALKVLDKSMEEMPDETIPYNFISIGVAENYYKLGQPEKANAILKRLATINEQDLKYYLSLSNKYFVNLETDAQQSMSILARTVSLAQENNQEKLAKELNQSFNAVEGLYRSKFGNGMQ